jgi:hypothetical protein
VPRWSLAGLSGFTGGVFIWGADALPYREWTFFSALVFAVGGLHLVTALLAALGSRHRRVAWRVQAAASLAVLAYLTYSVGTWAYYVAELYGGLGRGVAWVLVLFWSIAAAVTIPLSAWGLVATGGLALRKRGKAGVAAAVVACTAFGVARSRSAAAAEMLPVTSVRELARGAVGPFGSMAFIPAPASCAEPPGPDTATMVVASAAGIECRQGDLGILPAGRVKLDLVTARGPVVDLLSIRPGLDGVCFDDRCLMPWQLVALHAFNAYAPIDELREIRFGVDPAQLRELLGAPPGGFEGLTRIETQSLATDRFGSLQQLRRMRPKREELTAASLSEAVAAAEDYVASALREDGRFEYRLDPFTGVVDDRGLLIARQAGTTLVLCELARDRTRARTLATRALQMIGTTARRHEDLLMFRDPDAVGLRNYDLGDTALSAIAYLSCRDLVGDRFDAELEGAVRFLLAMQRPDGSFYPQFDSEDGDVVVGPDPLFAVGQAILALTLAEPMFPEARAAAEAAMDYTAQDYWSGFGADFFYMEENWHCLAARAALSHHRHDGYERFCIDYVHFKTRLILDDADVADPDFIGGYGFGNVLIPHSSGSATFGEAAAAALAVIDARGDDPGNVDDRLALALSFLVHHQWRDEACFACNADHPITGAFSEHMASPTIRIDYVQHAWGAMGHGGRRLGLL